MSKQILLADLLGASRIGIQIARKRGMSADLPIDRGATAEESKLARC